MDPAMNDLLKWSIENSEASRAAQAQSQGGEAQGQTQTQPEPSSRPLNAEALSSLLGGPSDAELMQHSMAVIVSSPTPTPNSSETDLEAEAARILENKLTAFDNLEQLIENIDNANNLEPLGLWTPLIGQLGNGEAKMRTMAGWCVGTAVQNNESAQKRVSSSSFLLYICPSSLSVLIDMLTLCLAQQLLVVGGIPKLVDVATTDTDDTSRRKAIYALSSAVRNFQPSLDEAVKHLPDEFVPSKDDKGKVDAANMDAIDEIMTKLRSNKPVAA